MAAFVLTKKQRLIATIAVSFSFFIVELAVGFITNSLALVADAFHYLSDLIGFVVALVALLIQEREKPAPKEFTFGYQRATLLGAFFNGVFLLALSVSILVQATERFVNLNPVENPKLVLIVGGIGLGLNILVLSFLHDHDHDHGHSHGNGHGHVHDHGHQDGQSHNHPSEEEGRGHSNGTQSFLNHTQHNHSKATTKKPDRDLGMLGVLIHVIGDAINNIGVMIAAVVIWKTEGYGRYYVDPAVSVFIGIMILVSALPLTKKSGAILLQVAPQGIGLDHVKEDMESIPGIISVHELHIWRLDQQKSIASAHIVLENATMESFAQRARDVMECLHAYGIHSVTLQPELHGGSVGASVDSGVATAFSASTSEGVEMTRRNAGGGSGGRCQISCASASTSCDTLKCCP